MQDSGEVCGGSDRWAIILSEPLFVCNGDGQAASLGQVGVSAEYDVCR